MTEKLPALQGVTTSEILKHHLDAMHSARKVFVKCEADEKIRRVLCHPVRATEETFNPGDNVFYKKEGKNRWLGPGKVIFQDGRVVFVRYGGVYIRVSTNRLVKDVCRREPVPLGCNVEAQQNHATQSPLSSIVEDPLNHATETPVTETIGELDQQNNAILEHLPEQGESSVQLQQQDPSKRNYVIEYKIC